MLDNRYDELKSSRVNPIDGEEAFALLKAKTRSTAQPPGMSSGYALHPQALADLDDMRDYIAQGNPTQPTGSCRRFLMLFAGLCLFPIGATDAPTSVRGLAVYSCT